MKNNDTFDDVTDVEPTEQNLMVVPEGANALINYEDKAREVEARVDLLNKIIPTLVKLCSQGDITDYGGKPFFGDNACQKIARVMAISFSQPKIDEEWIDDPETKRRVYSVVISGTASLFGQSVDAIGGCDSEDKFFTRKTGEGTYERRSGLSFTHLKLETRKKALSNWRGSCVRTLLGLKNIEWSLLESYGYRRGEGGSVSFKKDGKPTTTEATADIRNQLGTMILTDCGGDKTLAGQVLSTITSFENEKGTVVGPTSVAASNFTDKWVARTWEDVKPGGKKHEAYKNVVLSLAPKKEGAK